MPDDFRMTSQLIGAFVAAPFIYLGALALGRWLKRRHRVALGFSYQVLCLSVAVYVPLKALHVSKHPQGHAEPAAASVKTGNAVVDAAGDALVNWLRGTKEPPLPQEEWHDTGIRIFGTCVVLLGVVFALQLVRRFFWQRWFARRTGVDAPKFVQQISGFVVFTIALVMVLKITYRVDLDAFLAGSGILAVVIGFAMQETLANIVSGIALQIGKPFRVGDWLIVETHRAEVIEVNWRSTKLRTNDDIYLDIPNKTIVGSTITNLSYPTKTHAHRIRIGFEYSAPPNVVRDALSRAARDADGVLEQPMVKIFVVDFADSAVIYEIKYSIDDAARFNDIENHIRTNVWYEAKRAGLTIPFPIRTLHIQRPARGESLIMQKAREILEQQEILAPLDAREKAELLSRANIATFGRGEHIIRQGADGCSMFIILGGEADVFVSARGSEMHVATLREGEAFGEMCMLTGEARSASVVARTDCEVWEIRREVLQPFLHENSMLVGRMSELLAKRKVETDGLIAANAPQAVVEEKKKEYARGFLRRISSLFKV